MWLTPLVAASGEDLTFVIEPEDGRFAVYRSPLSAEDKPRYARVAVAPSVEGAQADVTYRQAAYRDQLDL